MPPVRNRDTQSRPLEVSTDTPQPPTLTIISPTPRTFTFPPSHNLSDSPYSTPSSSPFEPDLRSTSSYTPPLTRTLSPDSISSASPVPTTPQRRRKSSTGLSGGSSPDAERRPKKGDEDYIKRPENAFILFRRKCCEDRQLDPDSVSVSPSAPTKKQRQADLSKAISQRWKSLSTEERQYWEHLAKEKKKEHEILHPGYVYRPQRVRDKDGKVRNKKRQAKNQVVTQVPQPTSIPSATSPSTDSDSFSFILPRQHGRSASVPTPPPCSIQFPIMPQIIAPSCPPSPSPFHSPTSAEVPMISRRATQPYLESTEAIYDYSRLVPPAFAQAGFESNIQSSDSLRSIFGISPSSTTVSNDISSDATPIILPTHITTTNLLPPASITSPASSCSSGPRSPSQFLSQIECQPNLQYDMSPYLPEYTQYAMDFSKVPYPAEYSDYADIPDFPQPDGFVFSWELDANNFPVFGKSNEFAGGPTWTGGEEEFDPGNIPACEIGGVPTPTPMSMEQTPTNEKDLPQNVSIVARSLQDVDGGLELEMEQNIESYAPMELDMDDNVIMNMGMMMNGFDIEGYN